MQDPGNTRFLDVTPGGELRRVFQLKAAIVSDRVQLYDVFDAAGHLTSIVALPAGRHLVGFGAREVHLVYRDEDALEHVERYRR